jgi:hypothetical protein
MTKLPVGSTIRHAYSFTFGELGTIIGLCWLPLVLIAILQFLPYAFGGDPMAPAENATAQGRHGIESLVSSLVMILLYAVAYVPVTRQALGLRKGPAIVHFALGLPEFRVFGALLLFFLVIFAMAIGIGLLGLVAGGISVMTGKNPIAGFAFALVILTALLGFIYAIVRLGFLIVPVTVAENQVSLTRAWTLTRGNFWRIFGTLLAVLVPLYILHLGGLIALVGPGLFAPLPSNLALAEQVLASRFAQVGKHIPEYIGLTLILAPFNIGLGIGAAACAYKVLSPPTSGAASV